VTRPRRRTTCEPGLRARDLSELRTFMLLTMISRWLIFRATG
jgi:hypothetical protein